MTLRLPQVGLLLAALVLVSACGIADELDALAKEQAAKDALIDKLKAQDENAIEIVFATTYIQVFDSVGETIGAAVDAAMAQNAPSFHAAVTGDAVEEIKGSVNETVTVKTGGTVTIAGTYTVTPVDDKSMKLEADLTATWVGLKVVLKGGDVLTSGMSKTKGTVILGDGPGEGSFTWNGALAVDGTELPFDVTVVMQGDAVTMTGTINGTGYAIDVVKFANPGDEQKDDGLSSDAGIESITLSSGSLSPSFSETVNDYSATVSASTTSVRVSVSKKDSNATTRMSKTSGVGTLSGDTLSGLSQGSISLLAIEVTAADGTTTRTVNLTINVSAPL